MKKTDDIYNLQRFISAQDGIYNTALKEIKDGKKQTHWMWYIFPQITGLGRSATSKEYAIKSLEEAKEFLEHPLLGKRLIECIHELETANIIPINKIFGSLDSMKLKSSLTLFNYVANDQPIFDDILNKYFSGKRSSQTIRIISKLEKKDNTLQKDNNHPDVYILDELLIEINNLIYFREEYKVRKLFSILPNFFHANCSHGTQIPSYTICGRYVEIIKKHFFLICENNSSCSGEVKSRWLGLYVADKDYDRLNLDWCATNDLCGNAPQTDYSFSHFPMDVDYPECITETTKILAPHGINLVASIHENGIITGDNIEKLKHNGRIKFESYHPSIAWDIKFLKALVLLEETGNNNAKHALRREAKNPYFNSNML